MQKVDFTNTLTLGRQSFTVFEKNCSKLLKRIHGSDYSDERCSAFLLDLGKAKVSKYPKLVFSEPFFKVMGAMTVDSIDYSPYEEATILHDLSVQIPDDLKGKYTCVFDGGTLEHVFDYAIALRNSMDMVATGGHIVLMTPANNWYNHGFYQLQPELFYSVLREENGFTDTQIYTNDGKKWYLIGNPRVIGRAKVFPKWRYMDLYVVSRKASQPQSYIKAYQSYFEKKWSQKEDSKVPEKKTTKSSIKKLFYGLPVGVQKCIKRCVGKVRSNAITKKIRKKANEKRNFKITFTRVDI
jgi:hypothetical protein